MCNLNTLPSGKDIHWFNSVTAEMLLKGLIKNNNAIINIRYR